MIIDVNAQIGEPWGTLVSQTADELLARMDAAGVERAIVGPFPFGNFDNEYVARAVAAHAAHGGRRAAARGLREIDRGFGRLGGRGRTARGANGFP